jgi:hypothetical protein
VAVCVLCFVHAVSMTVPPSRPMEMVVMFLCVSSWALPRLMYMLSSVMRAGAAAAAGLGLLAGHSKGADELSRFLFLQGGLKRRAIWYGSMAAGGLCRVRSCGVGQSDGGTAFECLWLLTAVHSCWP